MEEKAKGNVLSRFFGKIKKLVCENKKTVIALGVCLLVIFGSAFIYWRPHYLEEGEKVLVNGSEFSPSYWQRYGIDQIRIAYEKEGAMQYLVIHKNLFGGEVAK